MMNSSFARHVTSRMLQVHSLSRLTRCQHMPRCYSKSSVPQGVDESQPLKYSGSAAAKWRAEDSRRGGPDDDKPWYQNIVISVSVSAFLVYFCILREENDIDEVLNSSIYSKVPGLEEAQLHHALTAHREKGLDTKEIEERLAVLREERKANSIK